MDKPGIEIALLRTKSPKLARNSPFFAEIFWYWREISNIEPTSDLAIRSKSLWGNKFLKGKLKKTGSLLQSHGLQQGEWYSELWKSYDCRSIQISIWIISPLGIPRTMFQNFPSPHGCNHYLRLINIFQNTVYWSKMKSRIGRIFISNLPKVFMYFSNVIKTMSTHVLMDG